MSRVLVAMVVLGTACAEPPCSRSLVSRNGDHVVDGGSTVAEYFPFGVDGLPLTGQVFAPLSACSSDRLRVTTEYIDADGTSIPIEPTAPQLHENGAVSVAVTLPAHPVGVLRFLKVTFEPALGERTTTVDFVPRKVIGNAVEVPVPDLTTCEQVTAMTTSQVACRRGNQLQVWSSDGGVLDFRGNAPVAAGIAVWSVSDLGKLERRELRDAGLVLTSTFPNNASTPFRVTSRPTMHSEDWAVRVDNDGLLAVVRKNSTSLRYEVCSGCTWLAGVIASGERAGFVPSGPCVRLLGSFAQCHDDLVAAEKRWRWLAVQDGTVIEGNVASMQIPAGNHRPIPFEIPAAEFSIIPPWFSAGAEGYRALGTVRLDGGAASVDISAWQFGDIVSVAESLVVLRKSENAVSVVER